ncbi:MAG: hypothetical protein F4X56_00440 [Gammaproteobacteria bacterium]|nr:hypothetical protein [Gammaproteobacteria bacterium]MXW07725.1 hypothetical protein [Gammaproteobacteria bacterium]MYC24367.1 hypothetical protein [Gammaproteobacteria bacterium]
MMKITRLFQWTIFGIIGLFGVIGFTNAVVTITAIDQDLTREARENSQDIAKAIADGNVDILLNNDLSTLQSRIDQMLSLLGSNGYIYITDENDEIIAHTFVPHIPEQISTGEITGDIIERTLKGKGDFIEVSHPILAGVGGNVHIGVDQGDVSLMIQGAMGNQVWPLAITFLVAIVLGILLVNLAARPIQQLLHYAVALAKKESVDEPHNEKLLERKDEAGDLARLYQYFALVADPNRSGIDAK